MSEVESIPKTFNTIVVTAGDPPAPCPGSPDKTISDLLPKLKTTTSKVYDYSLGNSKEIPLKHLCLPIWYRLEDKISDKAVQEIKESLGV